MLLFEKYKYWIVSYKYPVTTAYGDFSGQNGEFYLEALQDGENFQGQTIEKNVIDKSRQRVFGGKVTGTLRGTKLKFQKTYLPNTGLNHAIFYEADIDFRRGSIIGTWFVPQRLVANFPRGIFEMELDEGDFLKSGI